jgi:hypothetical protein
MKASRRLAENDIILSSFFRYDPLFVYVGALLRITAG